MIRTSVAIFALVTRETMAREASTPVCLLTAPEDAGHQLAGRHDVTVAGVVCFGQLECRGSVDQRRDWQFRRSLEVGD